MVFFFVRFKLAVVWYMALWLGLQLVMGFVGAADVAWWAHTGGFIAGAAGAWAVRRDVQHRILSEHPV